MKIFRDLDLAKETLGRSVLSVGNFDGVHLGHQAILKENIRLARTMDCASVVLTFEPHPQKVFRGGEAPPLLITLSQKLRILQELGIAVTIICPFDERIYNYSAEEFFAGILKAKLGVAHLVEGEDFTFGKKGTGSPELLKKLGKEHGVGVTIVDPVVLDGERISSSRIRTCIQGGDVLQARSLLGRPYAVEGRKIRGKGRGRTLGYPTVNLRVENELLPAIGIYAVQVELKERLFPGAASLGFNPTFEGDDFSFEVYLLDLEGEVNSEPISVLFHERLRDEIKFNSDRELIHQMEIDVGKVRSVFYKSDRAAEGPNPDDSSLPLRKTRPG
ncbi:MAG: bifunctional riboflavin kinase/FAD synthetase [Proteobacteria bacterium]|nr:bifunctional riboflavin kinase/FAD synthetase [Pseudomonadota bacterium]